MNIEVHKDPERPLLGIIIRAPETRGDWLEVLRIAYYGIGTLCVSTLLLMVLGSLFTG